MGQQYKGKQDTETSRRQIVRAVKNLRRRYALYYLKQHEEPAPLSDIADQVAAWERQNHPDEISPSHRKSVYNSLLQTHLPKLEELQIVDFDREDAAVELTRTGYEMDLYLANDPRTMIRWYRVYLALGVGGLLGVGLHLLNVQPVATVPLSVISTAFAAAVSVIAVVHWYDIYRWRKEHEDAPPDFTVEMNDE